MQHKILTGLSSAALTGAMLVNPVLADSSAQVISQTPASNDTQAVTQQSIRIGVIGEVQTPGAYFLTNEVEPDQNFVVQKLPTVTQAIQTAGGITPMADVRRVQVRRKAASGSTQTIDVDLFKYLSQNDLSQDIRLQEGDVVVVPFAP